MPVSWKLWEGQLVDQCFPLHRYIGGTEQSAVFLTQYGDPAPSNAAIKLVVGSAQDAELMARWDRAAQLSHPNLLRLMRCGNGQVNHQSVLYVVTEYAEEDLADVLAERPLTPAEVREMLKPLVDALAYIHGEGLVHGHLKPANIMAVGDQLKLSADGITTVGELNPVRSVAGAYDPPEFGLRGCSPVGDVWSFGMTLVEALTQELPRQTDPKEEPILPEKLPAEFVSMAHACLRIDPRKRASLDDILTQFRPQRAEPMKPPAELLPLEAPAKPRNWWALGLAGAATLGLASILIVPRISQRPARPTEPAQVAVPQPSISAKTEKLPAVPAAPVTTSPPRVTTPHPAKEPVPTPAAHSRRVDAQPGQIVHQVMPDIMDRARRTIHGKVKINVLVRVDPSGHVSSATVESQNSKYFANLTQKAAEKWTFEPKEAAGDWLLRFEFTTQGTEVRPSKVK